MANSYTNGLLKYTITNNINNSLGTKYFELHQIPISNRSFGKLNEIVEYEIEKYSNLKKERKNKNFLQNDTVKNIKELVRNFETINFQEELFKIIKH